MSTTKTKPKPRYRRTASREVADRLAKRHFGQLAYVCIEQKQLPIPRGGHEHPLVEVRRVRLLKYVGGGSIILGETEKASWMDCLDSTNQVFTLPEILLVREEVELEREEARKARQRARDEVIEGQGGPEYTDPRQAHLELPEEGEP